MIDSEPDLHKAYLYHLDALLILEIAAITKNFKINFHELLKNMLLIAQINNQVTLYIQI